MAAYVPHSYHVKSLALDGSRVTFQEQEGACGVDGCTQRTLSSMCPGVLRTYCDHQPSDQVAVPPANLPTGYKHKDQQLKYGCIAHYEAELLNCEKQGLWIRSLLILGGGSMHRRC